VRGWSWGPTTPALHLWDFRAGLDQLWSRRPNVHQQQLTGHDPRVWAVGYFHLVQMHQVELNTPHCEPKRDTWGARGETIQEHTSNPNSNVNVDESFQPKDILRLKVRLEVYAVKRMSELY